MNFVKIQTISKKDAIYLRPSFYITSDSDLMTRGGGLYAFWDEANHIWSKDLIRLVVAIDEELTTTYDSIISATKGVVVPEYVSDISNRVYYELVNFLKNAPPSYQTLDTKVTYLSQPTVRGDYATKRLTYDLDDSFPTAYDRLISVLYSEEERDKFEWAIGSILAGESDKIQKFFVFYGDSGTGKSTVLKIIKALFRDYAVTFNAAELGRSGSAFSLEPFASDPLVAIQDDGNLSRVDTNERLNSLVSHELMTMNMKHKSAYDFVSRALLFIGTNKPVKITDSKSGLKRRLIDIRPTNKRVSEDAYNALMSQIMNELGAIANFCLQKYKRMGMKYYNSYSPIEMVEETDYFYNFMADNIEQFQEGIDLKRAYQIYKTYCEESGIGFTLPKNKFRDEFREYFKIVRKNTTVNDKRYRYWYEQPTLITGATYTSPVDISVPEYEPLPDTESLLDSIFADCPAQPAKEDKPSYAWDNVTTTLKDILTSEVHYVRPPEGHIVIDFDLKDETGKKSLAKNLEAAMKWPKTYMEVSKGGAGLHLHYIYDGDPTALSYIYEDGIEVKAFPGKSSLRRKVTKCCNNPIAHISTGLPKKGVKKMVDFDKTMNEQNLRSMILRNCHKEYHAHTTPSVQFIKKLLDDMYEREEPYDVTDMRNGVATFASHSTNQAAYCLKLVNEMHFKSKEPAEDVPYSDEVPIVFFDCEVFPNLFIVCWKYQGADKECVRMINPTADEIGELISGRYRLIGFNNRRYDNHILYARYIGESNERLYQRTRGIIDKKDRSYMFGSAYNLSYTDVYDFASNMHKKGLKKWEIELGLKHQECPYPWDEPIEEKHWEEVADYCCNDVVATEAVFDHLQGDYAARLILAQISGLTPNDTTNAQTTKIIFGDEKRNPREYLNYVNLAETFPGYKYEMGKSTYLGEVVGEGGFVYAEPGIYFNVKVFDVASMHPSSIEAMNYLGEYTPRYSELKQIRLMIKHKDLDGLSTALGGSLRRFVEDPEFSLKDLSNALKTALNSVYGLTAAKFENKFRHPDNIDNIVAKRGALFMVKLKSELQQRGVQVVHIKTDSIKLENPTKETEKFVIDFGKQYGYDFEVENVYERMCLVNDAVYIARHEDGKWDATGAQFAEPYIFKTLFSKEPLTEKDYWQVRSSKDKIYLGDRFIGGTGAFLPVRNGEKLICKRADGREAALGGSKDWLWIEAVDYDKDIQELDMDYYRDISNKAIETISKYGDFERFVDPDDDMLPF